MKLILNWSKQQWLGMDAYQKVRSILAHFPFLSFTNHQLGVAIF